MKRDQGSRRQYMHIQCVRTGVHDDDAWSSCGLSLQPLQNFSVGAFGVFPVLQPLLGAAETCGCGCRLPQGPPVSRGFAAVIARERIEWSFFCLCASCDLIRPML